MELRAYMYMWSRLISQTKQGNIFNFINPFNPKLIMQILPTIQEENDWVM